MQVRHDERLELVRALRIASETMDRLAAALRVRDDIGRDEMSGKSVSERVAAVLEAAGDTPLTVNQIAAKAGVSAGAVRMVLYRDKQNFKCQHLSPRRVRWRLASPEVAAV